MKSLGWHHFYVFKNKESHKKAFHWTEQVFWMTLERISGKFLIRNGDFITPAGFSD